MNIAGVLLQVHPERMAEVRSALDRFPGVEVHKVTQDGRLLVTVEEEDAQGGTVLALHRLEGVLAASVAYHHFEPDDNGKDDGPDDEAITT
jgi:nitrate reductase NapD